MSIYNRECGCVEREWSTNQYAGISYCVSHYNDLPKETQMTSVITSDEKLNEIEEYFKTMNYIEDEPQAEIEKLTRLEMVEDRSLYEEYESYDDLPLHLQ